MARSRETQRPASPRFTDPPQPEGRVYGSAGMFLGASSYSYTPEAPGVQEDVQITFPKLRTMLRMIGLGRRG